MKDDDKQQRHDYYAAHPEIWDAHHQKQKERYAVDEDYRERRKAQWQRYEKANPEKRREKNLRVKAARRSTPSGKLDCIIRNTLSRAKKDGIIYDPAVIQLAKDPPKTCPCCGKELDYRTGLGQSNQSPLAPSCDRLIPYVGYVLGNVVIICKRCNQIKNEGDITDHLRVINYMQQPHTLVKEVILRVKTAVAQLSEEDLKRALARSRCKPPVPRWRPWNHFDFILRNARARAVEKGFVFEEDLLLLSQEPIAKCACCGVQLDYEAGDGQNPNAASIDRVDPTLGYAVENVDIICMRCNGIKSDGTVNDHLLVVEYTKAFTVRQSL